MRPLLFYAWAFVIGASVGLPPHHGKVAWLAYASAVWWAIVIYCNRRAVTDLIAPRPPCPECQRQFEWQQQQQQDSLDNIARWREQMAQDARGRAN